MESKLVGYIKGRFFVARYQRGYRWGQDEVKRLLDDMWEHQDKEYSLQPIVVKQRQEGDQEAWELVDGQQRLTSIYLILNYMKQAGLGGPGPMYEIHYETRAKSEQYLRHPNESESDDNIDYFHIWRAWECVDKWFKEVDVGERHFRAITLYRSFFKSVSVIWYEAPSHLDATALFTRLNIGRIPLTDAELTKAQILSQLPDKALSQRTLELAAEWDRIERDLYRPDVWAFITRAKPENYPTRITFLIDTLVDAIEKKPRGGVRPSYSTFETLKKQIEEKGAEALWGQVIDLHGLILGWYEDRDLYHKVGYLVAAGSKSFTDLVVLAQGSEKSVFEAQLDEEIRKSLDLSPSQVAELNYSNNADKYKCLRLLLLMNVETVRKIAEKNAESSERYSFGMHHAESWSLEHIHARNTEGFKEVDPWKRWLQEHREALAALPNDGEKLQDKLIQEVDDCLSNTMETRLEKFEELAEKVTHFFTLSDDEEDVDSMGAITNLALIPKGANSSLSNAVFEVKRRRILKLDRKGASIPICTRRVFLKYYTEDGIQQMHFWGPQDRENYLQAMISSEHGVLYKHLKTERDPQ